MGKKQLPLSHVYRLLEPGPVLLVTTSYRGQDNVMTLSWHTMIDFEPPLVGCVVSDQNFSFQLLKKSKSCVLNIPTSELLKTLVGIGNTSGRTLDKFHHFSIEREAASKVEAPLLSDCYVSLECKVVNTQLSKKYNLFILEVVEAWIRPRKKRPRMVHHCGKGVFILDGKEVKIPSKKK